MENKTRILTLLLLLCVGVLLGMMLTKSCSRQIEILTEIVKTDTVNVVRIDTVRVVRPQAVRVVRDTIRLTDTVYIGGQTFFQETKYYGDGSTYSLQISGINAYLDWIETYPKTITEYIYETKEVATQPKKLSLWAGVEFRKYGNTYQAPILLEARYNDNRHEFSVSGGYDVVNNRGIIESGYKRRF